MTVVMKLGSLSPKPFLLILGEDYKPLVKYVCRYGSISSLVLIHFPLFFKNSLNNNISKSKGI